jgi:hypothetical protein
MLRLLKVATPDTTVTVLVPERTAPTTPVPEVIDNVTCVVLSPLSTLPPRFSTATVIGGVMLDPAAVLLGWVMKTKFRAAANVGAAATMFKLSTSIRASRKSKLFLLITELLFLMLNYQTVL